MAVRGKSRYRKLLELGQISPSLLAIGTIPDEALLERYRGVSEVAREFAGLSRPEFLRDLERTYAKAVGPKAPAMPRAPVRRVTLSSATAEEVQNALHRALCKKRQS